MTSDLQLHDRIGQLRRRLGSTSTSSRESFADSDSDTQSTLTSPASGPAATPNIVADERGEVDDLSKLLLRTRALRHRLQVADSQPRQKPVLPPHHTQTFKAIDDREQADSTTGLERVSASVETAVETVDSIAGSSQAFQTEESTLPKPPDGATCHWHASPNLRLSCNPRPAQDWIARISQLHQRIVGRDFPALEKLTWLASAIAEEVKLLGYPPLVFASAETASEWIAGHTLNVVRLVAFLATDNFVESARTPLLVAGLVQDAGMLKLPDEVVFASASPSEQTRQRMEQHPHLAAEFLRNLKGLNPLAHRAAAAHHERLNGSGYPERLSASGMDLSARLLAVIDAYAHRRQPRPDGTLPSARQAMIKALTDAEAGFLDGQCCRQLLRLSLYPVGSVVELASGEIAQVVAPQESLADLALVALPVVRVLLGPEGQPAAPETYWNLAQRPSSRVVRELSPAEIQADLAPVTGL